MSIDNIIDMRIVVLLCAYSCARHSIGFHYHAARQVAPYAKTSGMFQSHEGFESMPYGAVLSRRYRIEVAVVTFHC
jgi:hypothetical protein